MRFAAALLLCMTLPAAAQTVSPQALPWLNPGMTAGPVTTLAPGATATATITGTPPNYILGLGIPAGAAGAAGSNGGQGPAGQPGPDTYSAPGARTFALATAYQCADPTTPCEVTINLTSSAGLSLTAGTSNTADILVGPTGAVAGGTGVIVGKYANSITGTLIVGLGINTVSAAPASLHIPTGYYFAVRQTAGTVAITSAFDQKVG